MNLVMFEVRFSAPWTSLKYKNEYKINSNECYFYQTLSDEVGRVALHLDLEYKLAETLAKIHGFSFVPNGIAGWNAIKEVFTERNLDINIKELKAKLVKRMTSSIDEKIGMELAPYIDEMYSNNVTTPEVKLVLECFRILKTLQPIKNESVKYFFELEEKVLKDLEKQSLKSGKIERININPYLPENMEPLITQLNKKDLKEVKEEYNEILDSFIKDYPNNTIEECVLWATSYYIQF